MAKSPKWAHTWIEIPKKFGPNERRAIAQDIIDYIQERTDRGRSVNNLPFRKYSKSYSQSLDFEIAGKSRGNPNLQLTGDMLVALEHLSDRPGSIHLGYQNGTDENEKAWWNDSTEGQVRRHFLGISQKDLKSQILSRYE